MSLPPIVLSGKSAASYVWNSYEGNCIAKMAKSAYAFFMGTRVCLSDARKYIARDATKNTYARSILERSVEVIDASDKKLLSMAQAETKAARRAACTPLPANPNVLASGTPNPSITAHISQPMPYMQQPMPYMQQPMPHMQQPMPHMQEPMPHMQQPMPQPAVAATNGSVSVEMMKPTVANYVRNAFQTTHQLLALLLANPANKGFVVAKLDRLSNEVEKFSQQINNGQMPKKDGMATLIKLIDDHMSLLPISQDTIGTMMRLADDLMEIIEIEDSEFDDDAVLNVLWKYKTEIKQAARELVTFIATEGKLGEPTKNALLRNLENIFTMLEPDKRNNPELGKKMTRGVAHLFSSLPAEMRRELFPFLPMNVRREFLDFWVGRSQADCLRCCGDEAQWEKVLRCYPEDMQDRIKAAI